MPEPFIYFYLRTPYEGLLSRRLLRFEANSVLEWFQSHFWGDGSAALDGKISYLEDSFQNHDGEEPFPFPKTWQELDKILEAIPSEGEHLFDGKTLCAMDDDDDQQFAYYVFESSFAKDHPNLVQFMLTDESNWPAVAHPEPNRAPFCPEVKVPQILPSGKSQGTVYGYFSNYYDSANLYDEENCFQIQGIRLNEFLNYLRTSKIPCTQPPEGELKTWPCELLLMRALIEDTDPTLETLFKRCDPWYDAPGPIDERASKEMIHSSLVEMQNKWHFYLGDASQSRTLFEEEHFFLFCSHRGPGWNRYPEEVRYFQMFLFDDVWASANPHLANSMFHYGKEWSHLAQKMTYRK